MFWNYQVIKSTKKNPEGIGILSYETWTNELDFVPQTLFVPIWLSPINSLFCKFDIFNPSDKLIEFIKPKLSQQRIFSKVYSISQIEISIETNIFITNRHVFLLIQNRKRKKNIADLMILLKTICVKKILAEQLIRISLATGPVQLLGVILHWEQTRWDCLSEMAHLLILKSRSL